MSQCWERYIIQKSVRRKIQDKVINKMNSQCFTLQNRHKTHSYLPKSDLVLIKSSEGQNPQRWYLQTFKKTTLNEDKYSFSSVKLLQYVGAILKPRGSCSNTIYSLKKAKSDAFLSTKSKLNTWWSDQWVDFPFWSGARFRSAPISSSNNAAADNILYEFV